MKKGAERDSGRARSEQAEVARVHKRRDCAERENHGIAALAVLESSHMFQVTLHIVRLVALCT